MDKNNFRFFTVAERPDLAQVVSKFPGQFWPLFMLQDPIANRLFGPLYQTFAEYQFALIDTGTDGIVAVGNSIPLAFDADPHLLPDDGWDWALQQGFEDLAGGLPLHCLCALQIVIDPKYRSLGLSTRMVLRMREIASAHSLNRLFAPVRPNQKSLYPLIPMEKYIRWKSEDGLPFDPWLRTHTRLGADIIRVCPSAMRIPGSVPDWETWTSMRLPETGEYIIPGALVPVRIDREANLGLYVEPNVWMCHQLGNSAARKS
ncbi:MAG: GNAT family N-acetyltransferase [Candidatus Zixiibacteriota bacterium]